MDKTLRLFLFVAVVGMTMISCKSKQKVTEIKSATVPATTVAPVQEAPKSVTPFSTQPEVTRSESFKLAAGETNSAAMSKKYHVQVGAFSNHDNARNLRAKLEAEGNNALVVENENGMLRVIIASFDEYSDARAKIDQIRSTYPDAWVLVQKK
ncbi:MAG: SPOR domain-containing protein [Paludibacter sp.]|nr:SPOR domain-containing protein [Paludibacter sp.]MDD4428087.1 SPOR domain-containing protein [Paludibacter sp.]